MPDTSAPALDRLAHDLRTPLTALKMAVTLLQTRRAKSTDAEELALLQALQRNVRRLEDMVAEFARSSTATEQK